MNREEHWEHVYQTKSPEQVSWFQPEAMLSRSIIQRVAPDFTAPIIDVGAGASLLVDDLLGLGYQSLSVMDISAAALDVSKARLAHRAGHVSWLVADVLNAQLPADTFSVWHDRAVFHFLTDAHDRARYVAQVAHALRPRGYLLIATFAEDGPTRCSGLDVARYSPAALHQEFGPAFRLIESHREQHSTPAGVQQAFTCCLCQYQP